MENVKLNAFVWKLLLKFGLNLEYICFEASPFIVANKQDMLSAQCCQPNKTTLEQMYSGLSSQINVVMRISEKVNYERCKLDSFPRWRVPSFSALYSVHDKIMKQFCREEFSDFALYAFFWNSWLQMLF